MPTAMHAFFREKATPNNNKTEATPMMHKLMNSCHALMHNAHAGTFMHFVRFTNGSVMLGFRTVYTLV